MDSNPADSPSPDAHSEATLTRLLTAIDSRAIFETTVPRLWRFSAHAGSIIVAFIVVMSFGKIFEGYREGAHQFGAIISHLCLLATTFAAWKLALARSEIFAPSDKSLALLLPRILILGLEFGVLSLLATGVTIGLVMVAVGPHASDALLLSASAFESSGDKLVSSLMQDSAFLVRFGGLITIAASALTAFFALFAALSLHDLCRDIIRRSNVAAALIVIGALSALPTLGWMIF